MSKTFNPPFYIRSAYAQTFLASNKFGTQWNNPILKNSKEVILNPVGQVRLQGFYSPQPNAKGLVILLHGWEGSVNSAYILRTAKFLYQNGFSVFRLNFRDHGETHHLNPGIFYAALLDEVFGAVQQVARYEPALPFYVIGFSMGGNFALRIARKAEESPIPNLKHVIAISPVLDPEKSTYAIDEFPLLRDYFRKKWTDSMRKKQALFPELYQLYDVFSLPTIAEMTERMLQRHSDYPSASAYFRAYAVTGEALAALSTPLTVITAQDDPIIPVSDFHHLKLSSTGELLIQPYGGHNGFLENIFGKAWYQRKIAEILLPLG